MSESDVLELVSGAADERSIRPGDVVAHALDELHGLRANEEKLIIAAVIAPRPAAR
jgi:quercetin dioxygenase-like cupin family protein